MFTSGENSRKRALIAVASLSTFAFGLIAFNGRSLASTLFGDPFFAVAFSIIPVVIGIPIFVAIGFALRWIANRVLKRQLPGQSYLPWLVPAVSGIGCFIAAFVVGRSPKTLFREFPGIDPPASMSDFEYWWTTLPGDTLYVFSFKIHPSEFNKLLVNHHFEMVSDPEEIQQALKENFLTNYPGMRIRMPAAPLVTVYKYSAEGPPALPHVIDVFTTEDRKQILICGDN